ncbi:hypothetical protein LSTR_LSTR008709, partial [Laodelphax striatellus]
MLVAGQFLVALGDDTSSKTVMKQKVFKIIADVYDDQDEIFLMQAILRSDAFSKSLHEEDLEIFLENKEAFDKFKMYMTSYCNSVGKIATTLQSIEKMIIKEYEKSQPQYLAALIIDNPFFKGL